MKTSQLIRLVFVLVFFVVAGKQLVTADDHANPPKHNLCRKSGFSSAEGDCFAVPCHIECLNRFGSRSVGKCDITALYLCHCYLPC
ncbi:hypothetical protein LINGRAHAP2_LOCUS29872 [Linum grandiflorum]